MAKAIITTTLVKKNIRIQKNMASGITGLPCGDSFREYSECQKHMDINSIILETPKGHKVVIPFEEVDEVDGVTTFDDLMALYMAIKNSLGL